MKSFRFTSLAGLAALWLAALPALGEEKPPGKRPEPTAQAAAKSPEENIVVSDHTITIAGKATPYKVSTGYLVLKEENEKGGKGGGEKDGPPASGKDALKPKAKIFFVAYTRETSEATRRPLTFAFNGGPGAASVWLHLGALGPRRVQLGELGKGTPPPYQLVDNEFSWLDETDLVFIDPVSTGFSRPVPGESAQAFHGFNEDLQSVAEFIRQYVSQQGRWLSPKFLVGESYGGTRAAALAGLLQDRFDLYLNGIVIVSGVLNWQTIDFRPGNDLPYALFLPSFTATAQFHRKLPAPLQKTPLPELLLGAEKFALEEYLPALHRGSALPPADRARILQRLSDYTGLPQDLLSRYRLRMPAGQFMDELLKTDNRSVGRFDSRLKGIFSDPDGSNYDPSFTTMRGNFTAAMNAYVKSELRFDTELPYRSLAGVNPWNFGNFENRYLDVADGLTRAITKNPGMKVWVVTGYYDLAVSYFGTDYTLRQMGLAPELQANVRTTKYASGHMVYTDVAVLKAFKDDFHTFISDTLKPAP